MFSLSKWYCDCVSDGGIAFVGYWARMRWGPLSIPYSATLYKPLWGPTSERYVLRPCSAPAIHGDELRWDCRRLGIQAEWTAHGTAIRRTLLETADDSISWCCRIPCARARVDLVGMGRLSGLGYAERLTLSVRSWRRLPFERLRWGRFLSAEDALTWIEWRGREHRQWVFHNGAELRGAIIDAERVELPGGRGNLELRDAVALREGRLGSTALRAIPGARFWLPGMIRDAHEAKWLARGTFTRGTRSSSGWVVHEVVRLP